MRKNLISCQGPKNVLVLGAGAAGFSAALELAKRGYQVDLLEKNTLGSGASGRNPGRMGHGFHYVDAETAKMYLRASIEVQRQYPHYLLGQEFDFHHPFRHGRYFITKDSDQPKEKILACYAEIKKEYARLIAEDPANQVFGPVEGFYRILNPDDYAGIVNVDRVELGIETAEHLFRWQDFSLAIKKILSNEPKIRLHEHTEVLHLSRGNSKKARFIVHAKKTQGPKARLVFSTDYLINSTWQDIEYFNHQLGLPLPERTNRLKSLLIVKLPPSLRECHSMFFCMGKHCMLSNMGDGRAMMTFADVTNLEVSTSLRMSSKAQRLLEGGVTEAEKSEIVKDMLQGIAGYIPDIIHAEVEALIFGVVQTEGRLSLADLSSPDSSVHKRAYLGVREEELGLISNPCVKLFYFIANGRMVADLIDKQFKA